MGVSFRVAPVEASSISNLYLQREEIWLDPPYQRAADIWPLEKRQLLIDSLLNGFDIPKFYMHDFYPGRTVKGHDYRYAIIDGKQRMSAIWQYIEGAFPLDKDTELINSPEIKLGGLTYAELGQQHPRLKAEFDARHLSVVGIQTDDTELIEEMFSRLNEAVALSAAEKRNALRGPLPNAIRSLAEEQLFTSRLPFGNSRYRHYDLSCKFLLLTDELMTPLESFPDLKKAYLDGFVIDFRKQKRDKRAKELLIEARKVVRRLNRLFVDKDWLLRQVGMATLYFALAVEFDDAFTSGAISRQKLEGFEKLREQNRVIAEKNVAKARYDLLEFDRLAQSPNDSVALAYRFTVLAEHLGLAIK